MVTLAKVLILTDSVSPAAVFPPAFPHMWAWPSPSVVPSVGETADIRHHHQTLNHVVGAGEQPKHERVFKMTQSNMKLCVLVGNLKTYRSISVNKIMS